MDRYEDFASKLLRLAGRMWFEWAEGELWDFGEAVHHWLDAVTAQPTRHWRQSLNGVLAEQAAKGRILVTESRQALIEHLEQWEATIDWSASGGETTRPAAPASSVQLASDDGARSNAAVAAAAAPPKPVPKNWPALTPAEAEAAQRDTGLPWWYPLQPRNRMDSVWERQLVNFGQAARERLLGFFREVAALGRMARAISDRDIEELGAVDLEALAAQCEKIQTAYDQYVAAKVEIYRTWTRYLSTETFVGPEVFKVFTKVDNGLPDRVEGLKSPADESLKRTRRAAQEATDRKVRRTDAAYTALVWTDRALTIIEIATLIGTAKAVFTQTTKTMVAKGLSTAAARKVAMTQVVAHVATAAASAAAVGGVLPRVLSAAGLDESEVRAGLAVFRAAFTILGLRAVAKSGAGHSPATHKAVKDHLRHLRMREGKTAEAGRPYSYSQVYLQKPSGKGYWILDYYDPLTGEIVSFKDTQLASVMLKTAIGFLNELKRKYTPGRIVADVPSNKDLVGKKLVGRMIMEVPVQDRPVPEAVLEAAKIRDIRIRDTSGRVYE